MQYTAKSIPENSAAPPGLLGRCHLLGRQAVMTMGTHSLGTGSWHRLYDRVPG